MNTEENINAVNMIVKTTALVAHVICGYIKKGDLVVDCTMGNGHDTLTLVSAVGITGTSSSAGRVYAFDVQDAALEETKKLLSRHGINNPEKSGIYLIKDSHEKLAHYLSKEEKKPSAIVFNLGFMPGKDKKILTKRKSTVNAVKQAIDLIADDGIVSVTTYSGHEEGAEENAALLYYLSTLSSKKYHVAYVNMINQKKAAPAVFFITRKKKK